MNSSSQLEKKSSIKLVASKLIPSHDAEESSAPHNDSVTRKQIAKAEEISTQALINKQREATRKSELNQLTIQTAAKTTKSISAGFTAALFGAFTNPKLALSIFKGTGHYIVGPVSLGFALIQACISLTQLIKAKNKNISLASTLFIDVLAATIIAGSTIGGLVATIMMGAIIPYLISASIAIKAIEELAKMLISAYKWMVTKDDESRKQYKKDFIQHLVASIMTVGLTAIVTTLVIFKIATFVLSVTAASICAVAFATGVAKALVDYNKNKNSLTLPQDPLNDQVDDKTITPPSEVNTAKKTHSTTTIHDTLSPKGEVPLKEKIEATTLLPTPLPAPEANSKEQKWNFYYQAKRAEHVSNEHLTSRKYLVQEAAKKIAYLNCAIDQSSLLDRMQLTKRQAKRDLLEAVRELLEKKPESNDYATFEALITKAHKSVYQSFFKEKSDTEDFIEACRRYFTMTKVVTPIKRKSC